MKRLIVLTILVTIAISTTGCRRGLRTWGLRGARCGAPVAPTYTPVPAYPAPCPTMSCPPVAASPCDACPPYGNYNSSYGGTIIDGGVVGGSVIHDGSVIDGSMIGTPSPTIDGSGAAFQAPAINTLPAPNYDSSTLNGLPTFNGLPAGFPGGHRGIDLSQQMIPNKPVFSHIIGDRKLEPGETLKGEYELPVESAAAAANEKK